MPGEFGTLSEIAFALKYGKPVISLGPWDIDPKVIAVSDPKQAVERALSEVANG
jgi:hypothetical protein